MSNRRDGSVKAAHLPNRAGGGGSIPTPSLFFHVGKTEDAQDLVAGYHYSHRWPSNVQFVGTFHEPGGLFGDMGEPVAACVFSIPPTRWAEPVLELSRLVRRDDVRPELSRLIKLCCVYLKRDAAFDLLVSFADRTFRHHGGIYQASNWNYAGCRDPQMDGLLIEGRFVPGRSCNSRWGTRAPDKVRDLVPSCVSVEPHYDDGKHLYWKALSASGETKARRLGLASLPYPKPAKNTPATYRDHWSAPVPGGFKVKGEGQT